MLFIVNNLFVGNKLAARRDRDLGGRRINLRNIRSAHRGVRLAGATTSRPPQQALNWIIDCYSSDAKYISLHEQTIVYLLHQDIGHLGIFVSGKVAKREHTEIVQTLDVIETLPPGLYEMVIEDKQPETPSSELIPGRYVVRFERRSLDDIRALEDTREDEKPFGAVARVSEITESMYRTFVRPWVQALTTDATADTLRQLHPHRLQYSLLSDQNPWMQPLEQLAEWVRENRQAVSPDNPFLAIEKAMSRQITDALKRYGETRDYASKLMFNAIYTSPWLQAVLGLRSASAEAPTLHARDAAHEALVTQKVAALRARIDQGGLREGVVRIILYAGAAEGSVDTRGFRMVERLREEYFATELAALPPAQRREFFKEQFFMLLLDEDAALAALPKLLSTDEERRNALEAAQRVLSAVGDLTPARKARLRLVAEYPGREGCGAQGGEARKTIMTTRTTEGGPATGSGKYERLIERTRAIPAIPTAVAHPCDEVSLGAAVEAGRLEIITPLLVGPAQKIRAVAEKSGFDISAYELVDAPHSQAAAARAVELVRLARAELLMKGSLHTDELISEVVKRETGLRTARRISHVFIMDVPTYHKPLTDHGCGD